ncbi:Phosphoglycerate dehydrogenase [Arthrobacter sp. yr096]|uniref:hydroxyacid dehydrogenase n=1 Tax=unclassified Arthrobacter TaxID=235627 RepID=UPI00089C60C7|nr:MULTISPECIES: hydroxyacid dehydrogenase [unclassified Arthrobacter]SDX19123.1 Phosphoglycerate dehydrogenase [Arthrobacter sp. cf158]SEI43374.1 Phosphoglycerate dehydrogenase [Arthrobacter sp. yr096]
MTTNLHQAGAIKAAFAMGRNNLRTLFSSEDLARLHGMVTLLDSEPIADFAARGALEKLRGVQLLITGWGAPAIDGFVLDQLPELRCIVHAAGTVKTFLSPEVYARGIEVSSSAAANAVPVAEYTFAAIVMGLKRARRFSEQLRITGASRNASGFPTIGTNGVTIGLVGASRVGRLVIGLLKNLDARVLVYDPYLTAVEASALGVETVGLDQLCALSDVVSVHAPDIAETKGIIGAQQLGLMKDGTLVINTARGALIDAVALTAELVSGRLDAYLDVTEPEPLPIGSVLHTLPNVVLTPHIAGAMGNEIHRLGSHAVMEIRRLTEGLPLAYPVLAADLARIA